MIYLTLMGIVTVILAVADFLLEMSRSGEK